MQWLHELCYFFGGACLTNAVPHWISGLTGRAFQTPFANPPGKSLSSATVNVLWGFFNLVAGYALIFQVGLFDPRAAIPMLAVGVGVLMTALMLARIFGPLHGGNEKRSGLS